MGFYGSLVYLEGVPGPGLELACHNKGSIDLMDGVEVREIVLPKDVKMLILMTHW